LRNQAVKIAEILTQQMVVDDLKASEKTGVLRELASHLANGMPAARLSTDLIFTALNEREKLGSTGVGEGIAIPHAKIVGLTALLAAFGRSLKGIAFDAVDRQAAHLIFVLLVPEDSAGAHLKALARVSRLLKSPAFRERLLAAPDGASIYQAILEEDAKY
jgi:PTS system nitrogen regulatory IIA component